MSRVVRCYGTKRRALVGGVSAGASSMVNDLVEDALEFSTSTVRHVKACNLVYGPAAQHKDSFEMHLAGPARAALPSPGLPNTCPPKWLDANALR